MYYTKLTETSACGFSPPPEDRTDLVRVIELVLEAERCAIEKCRMVQHYSSELVVQLVVLVMFTSYILMIQF